MTAIQRLEESFQSVYEDEAGEAWYGPSILPLLTGVTPEQAAKKPFASAHSIWELVMHIAYWESVALRRLKGEKVDAPLNSEQDWATVKHRSEPAWKTAVSELKQGNSALREELRHCSEEKMQQRATGKQYSNYVMVEGTLHHAIYHSGQISMLKTALARS